MGIKRNKPGTGSVDTSSLVQQSAYANDKAALEQSVLAVNNDIREIAVTPKQFGAVGGGATNDHSALITALQYCNDNNKRLYLDDVYGSEDIINLSAFENVFIFGKKWFKSGIIALEDLDYVLYHDGVTNSNNFNFENFSIDCGHIADTGIRMLQGKGHKFRGMMVYEPPANGKGYWFGYPGAPGATFYEAQIVDCKFDGGRENAIASTRTDADYGLYLDAGVTDSDIGGFISAYCQEEAIHVKSGGNIFTGGHVYGGMKKGFWYDGSVSVTGMYFDTPAEHAIYADSPGGSFSNCLFTCNTSANFYNPLAYGFGSSGTFPVEIRGGHIQNYQSLIDPSANLGQDSVVDIIQRNVTQSQARYSSGGTCFGGRNNTPFDFYDTGTWQAELYDAASGGVASATTAVGKWTQVGNLMFCQFDDLLNIDTSGMNQSSQLRLTLPKTPNGASSGKCRFAGVSLNGRSALTVSAKFGRATFVASGDGQSQHTLLVSDLTSGSASLRDFSLVYTV